MTKKPTLHDVPARYCSKCGALLIDHEVPMGYDTETGDKSVRVVSTCPRKRWYNGHDKFTRMYRRLPKGKYEWIP